MAESDEKARTNETPATKEGEKNTPEQKKAFEQKQEKIKTEQQARDKEEAQERKGSPETVVLEASLKHEGRKDDIEYQATIRAQAEWKVSYPAQEGETKDQTLDRLKKISELKKKYIQLYKEKPEEMKKFRDTPIEEQNKYLRGLAEEKKEDWNKSKEERKNEKEMEMITALLRLRGFGDREASAFLKTDDGKKWGNPDLIKKIEERAEGAEKFLKELKEKRETEAKARAEAEKSKPTETSSPTTSSATDNPKDFPDFVKKYGAFLGFFAFLASLMKGGSFASGGSFEKTPDKKGDDSIKKDRPESDKTTPKTSEKTTSQLTLWQGVEQKLQEGGITADTSFNSAVQEPFTAENREQVEKALPYLRLLALKQGVFTKLENPYRYQRGDEAIITLLLTEKDQVGNQKKMEGLVEEFLAKPDAVKDFRSFIAFLKIKQATNKQTENSDGKKPVA